MAEKNRYDFENLPISEETRKGLTSENINQIGTIGRMLSLQDEVYEDAFEKLTAMLTKRFDKLDKDIRKINREIAELKKKDLALEKKIEDVNSELKKFYLEFKEHTHPLAS